MSIYKPSNFSPSFEEVDPSADIDFSCQVNTNGDPIKAYKMTILSSRGDDVKYCEGMPTTVNIPNKSFLTYSRTPALLNLSANNDYLWGIRVYDHQPRDPYVSGTYDKSKTFICDGYTVGSTKNVIWARINSKDTMSKLALDQIKQDRYIEFTANSAADIILGNKDFLTVLLPTSYPYTERLKITYVTKDLGVDENIVKIETEDPFKYNYKNNMAFSIFQCSNENTVNSMFSDPNSNVNISDWLIIYKSLSYALKARDIDHDTPASPDNASRSVCMLPVIGSGNRTSRKIVGYSSDTGEFRVNDAFYIPPKKGIDTDNETLEIIDEPQCYRIFSYNSATSVYTPVDDGNLSNHIVGGSAISNAEFQEFYKTIQNNDSTLDRRIFIQPNTNIKSDFSNPPQFEFSDGRRYIAEERISINKNLINGVNFLNITNFKSSSIVYNSQGGFNILLHNGGRHYNNKFPLSSILTGNTSCIFLPDSSALADYTLITILYSQNINVESPTYTDIITINKPASLDFNHPILFFAQFSSDLSYVSDIMLVDLFNLLDGTETLSTIPYTPIMEEIPLEHRYRVFQKLLGKQYLYDSTINKLDNSQWLLEGLNIKKIQSTETVDVIRPQTDYSTYCDFIDGSPYLMMYARTPLPMHIYYANYNLIPLQGPLPEVTDNSILPYKDMIFFYNSDMSQYTGDISLKYFQYFLYDDLTDTLIAKSPETYDTSVSWFYRGFDYLDLENEHTNRYRLQLDFIDEYSKKFTKEVKFLVNYNVESDSGYITCTQDCHESSIIINCLIPEDAITTDYTVEGTPLIPGMTQNLSTVELSDQSEDRICLHIPNGKTANYNMYRKGEDVLSINLPKNMYLITSFKLTSAFVNSIPLNGSKVIFSLKRDKSSSEKETLTFKMFSLYKYYMLYDEEYLQVEVILNDKPSYILVFRDLESTPLQCFWNQTTQSYDDYYNVSIGLPELVQYNNIRYSLLSETNYIVGNTLPYSGEDGKYYVLTSAWNTYSPGVYLWNPSTRQWYVSESYTYLYLEQNSQFPATQQHPEGYIPLDFAPNDLVLELKPVYVMWDGSSSSITIDKYHFVTNKLPDYSDGFVNTIAYFKTIEKEERYGHTVEFCDEIEGLPGFYGIGFYNTDPATKEEIPYYIIALLNYGDNLFPTGMYYFKDDNFHTYLLWNNYTLQRLTYGNPSKSETEQPYVYIDTQRSLDLINSSTYNNNIFTILLKCDTDENDNITYDCQVRVDKLS